MKRKAKAAASKDQRAGSRATVPDQSPEKNELAILVRTMFRGKIDRTLIRKNVQLSARLRKILAAASPKSTVNLVSGIAVDLADFWEIGEEHRRRVQKLLNMQFPKDTKRLEDMLYEFEIRLVTHAEWHAKHLRKLLPKLKHDLRK